MADDIMRGNMSGMAKPGEDRRYVEFHMVSWLNRSKSAEQGIPVHEPVTFIKIQHPGEVDFNDRPATESDKREFARQWQAFNEGRAAIPEGTPVNALYPRHPEIVQMLQYNKVFTIQQLAALNDTQLQNLGMGALKMRQDAIGYLDATKDGKEFHKLREENERMKFDLQAKDDRLRALEAAVSALQAQLGQNNGPISTQQSAIRGPGRPPNPRPNI